MSVMNQKTDVITSFLSVFKSYEDAVSFLYKAIDYEKLISYQYNTSTFSLDRMEKLLAYAGNPHKELPCIHITGTKGKGSTAIMISTILEQSGLTTGLFTSPHFIDIKERIQINRQKISAREFTRIMNDLQPYIQYVREREPSDAPTFFEILTAVGMLYFRSRQTEMAVLEVGLGGRLDATNVVLPQVSIITNVGFDHMAILGNTLSSIAYEKAGIVKQGVPVVSGVEDPEALLVIEKICKEKDAPLYLFGRDMWVEDVQGFDRNGTKGLMCRIKTWLHTYDDIFLPLVGVHQAQNCALVLGALEVMRERGNMSINNDVVQEALSTLYCPARIEVVAKNPIIILDFAHTVDSMRFLKKTLMENFKFNKLILIMGFSQDKDLNNILQEIVVVGDSIIVTKSKNPRAAEPEDLYQRIEKLCGKQPEMMDNIRDAIIAAKQIASQEDLICITGSAYVAGEARQVLEL
jgi:dihydrofolate synthase/folylpolyglutamate synthase